MLELKLQFSDGSRVEYDPPNRTMLELKHGDELGKYGEGEAPNRTMLELKPGMYDQAGNVITNSQSHHAGIETKKVR